MSATRVQKIFEAALEIADHHDRKAMMDRACDGDPQLRARLDELLAGRDVRVIASGHRHCRVVRDGRQGETHVWAPSTTLAASEAYHGGDPAPGAVEFHFAPDGTWSYRFLDP